MNDEKAERPWMNSLEKIIALEQHEQQQQQKGLLCKVQRKEKRWKNVNKKKYLSKVQTTHSAAKND